MAGESLYNAQQVETPDGHGKYTVKAGDTLAKIAGQYPGLTIDQLATTNKIDNPDKIRVGDTINIPIANKPTGPEAVAPATVPDAQEQSAVGGTNNETAVDFKEGSVAAVSDASASAEPNKTTENKPSAQAASVPQNTMSELYERLYPKPKELELSEEDKAKRQRQNQASAIILGIADAINGFSNLYATTQGAPSREVSPASSKWGDAVAAMNRTQQEKIDKYREGFYRAKLDDFKLSEERRRLAEQRRWQLENRSADNEEWTRRSSIQNEADFDNWLKKYGITEQSAIDQAKREFGFWTQKEKIQHSNRMETVAEQNAGRVQAVIARENAKSNAKAVPFAGTLENGETYNYSWPERYDSQNYYELYRLMTNAVKADAKANKRESNRKYKSDISIKFNAYSEMPTLNKMKVLVDKYFADFADDVKSDFDSYLVSTGQYNSETVEKSDNTADEEEDWGQYGRNE